VTESNQPIRWKMIILAILAGSLASTAIPSVPAMAQSPEQPPAISATPIQMPSFAPVVRQAVGAVVSLSVTEAGGGRKGAGSSPSSTDVSPGRSRTLGSGFLIDPSGYIVTDSHVVERSRQVTATLSDGTQSPARLVGNDPASDLALLKIEAAHELPYLPWADSDATEAGDWVIALGNPFGLGKSVSVGVISARARDIRNGLVDDYLQFDAAINQGSSGGPILNETGSIIGVITSFYSPNGGSVGVSFAVPAKRAIAVVEQLRANGEVRHPWIGASLQEATPALAKALGLPLVGGALVDDVVAEGPAALAGLRRGDVVTAFGCRAINEMRDLPLVIEDSRIGEEAEIAVWRNRTSLTMLLRVGELPGEGGTKAVADREEVLSKPGRDTIGLAFAPLPRGRRGRLEFPSDLKGVVVVQISGDGPFADADLEVGDILLEVNQQPVPTPKDAVGRLKDALAPPGRPVLLLLNRHGKIHYTAQALDERALAGQPEAKGLQQAGPLLAGDGGAP